ELDLRTEPWVVRDATADVVQTGQEAVAAKGREQQETRDKAAALVAELKRRHEAGEPALGKRAAETFLQEVGGLKRAHGRDLLASRQGLSWTLRPDPADARSMLVTLALSDRAAAVSGDSAEPHQQRLFDTSNRICHL